MRVRGFVVGACLSLSAFGLAAVVIEAEQSGREPEWRRLILSRDGHDISRAAAIVLDERKTTVNSLLEVVELPVTKGELFFNDGTPRNMATRLVGDLRASEAVPALAKWLMPRAGQEAGIHARLTDLSPAGQALVKIATPALPAVGDILATVGVSSEDKVHVHFSGSTAELYPRPSGLARSLSSFNCLLPMVLHRQRIRQPSPTKPRRAETHQPGILASLPRRRQRKLALSLITLLPR